MVMTREQYEDLVVYGPKAGRGTLSSAEVLEHYRWVLEKAEGEVERLRRVVGELEGEVEA